MRKSNGIRGTHIVIESLIWIFIPTFISFAAKAKMPWLLAVPILWSFYKLVLLKTIFDYKNMKKPDKGE
jgi:hypothetical protein